MGQAALRVRAGGLSRNPRGGAALLVYLLSTGIWTAPQAFGAPPEPSPIARPHLVSSAFQPRAGRRQAPANSGEQESAPKTFVDMSPADLARTIPELKRLESAKNQDLLPQILKRAGDEVAAFFDDFQNTTSTEEVTSMVDSGFKAGDFHSYAKYNYVALAEAGGEKDRLREFRADDKGAPVKPDPGRSVVTVGFISMMEHLHPDFQPDSRFLYLGREEMEDANTYVVAFAQRPSVARRVTRIQFLGQDEIAFWQGIVWIDPVTFRIRRLRSDVQVPPKHVGMLRATTEILYSEVSFQQGGTKLWLPREVTVTGQLNQYRYRNLHRYSDYRLFKVAVDEKRQSP